MTNRQRVAGIAVLLALGLSMGACRREQAAKTETGKPTTLLLGAYTTPREAYRDAILPAFEKAWKAKTGGAVDFRSAVPEKSELS